MPDITLRSAVVPANSFLLPFGEAQANWKFRRCPYGRGLYTILLRTTGAAGNIKARIEIGTTQVLQDSDVSVGATDATMPTPAGAQATPAHQFFAEAGDEVILTLLDTAGAGTARVMIWANVEPHGG